MRSDDPLIYSILNGGEGIGLSQSTHETRLARNVTPIQSRSRACQGAVNGQCYVRIVEREYTREQVDAVAAVAAAAAAAPCSGITEPRNVDSPRRRRCIVEGTVFAAIILIGRADDLTLFVVRLLHRHQTDGAREREQALPASDEQKYAADESSNF
jgi:hypothetical protein